MLPMFADHGVVGLLLTDEYLYGVEISVARGSDYRFQRRARVPTPRGAYSHGTVTDVDLFAHSLRELWRSGSFTAKHVILGLPSHMCQWRRLDLPPASRDEQLLILRNEQEADGMFDPEREVIDFMPLALPAGEEGTPVAVVSAEEPRIQSLRQALQAAGLALEAAEPLPLSLVRLSALSLNQDDAACVILISAGLAEVAVVQNGAIRFHRRVNGDWQPAHRPNDGSEGSAPEPEMFSALTQEEQAQGLLMEIRRTLLFCQRLGPELPAPRRAYLLTDNPDLEEFLKVVSNSNSAIPCVPMEAHLLPHLPVVAQEQLAGRGISGYLLALGLALRRRADFAETARLDLGKGDERLYLVRNAAEIRTRALVAGSVWLVVNAALWFLVAGRIQEKMDEIQQVKTRVEQTREQLKPVWDHLAVVEAARADQRKTEIWPERWMEALGRLTTDDVQVDSIDVADGVLTLEVTARNGAVAEEVLARLQTGLPLKNPKPPALSEGENRRMSVTLVSPVEGAPTEDSISRALSLRPLREGATPRVRITPDAGRETGGSESPAAARGTRASELAEVPR
ncbi:MAG: hypothetical protein ACK47B_24630 [Armatimonadota bacterium]